MVSRKTGLPQQILSFTFSEDVRHGLESFERTFKIYQTAEECDLQDDVKMCGAETTWAACATPRK
eukprot:1976068-Amphidinium_carterae.1